MEGKIEEKLKRMRLLCPLSPFSSKLVEVRRSTEKPFLLY